MIQLNLKPDKLLPSVFTSQPVIAHDTLGADTAMQALPLVFFVSIKDHSLVMLHFSLSLMGVCVWVPEDICLNGRSCAWIGS